MKTLNDIVVDIQFSFSDDPFKLLVQYESKEWDSQLEIFFSVSDDDEEWSAFRRIYGECRVTMLEIDFREAPDGKNRIWLHLLNDDTMKIRATKKQATSDK